MISFQFTAQELICLVGLFFICAISLFTVMVAFYLDHSEYRKIALRYLFLRSNRWCDGPETLCVVRARDLKVQADAPSGKRLDDIIDAEIGRKIK